jgi:hypothetical protein
MADAQEPKDELSEARRIMGTLARTPHKPHKPAVERAARINKRKKKTTRTKGR